MSVMAKKKKVKYDTHFIDAYRQYDEPLQIRLSLDYTALKYVAKLGKANWRLPNMKNIDGDHYEEDWADGELQAELIYSRLKELIGDASLDAQRERAFLQHQARRLLVTYSSISDGSGFGYSPHPPALPADLFYILEEEYPGLEGLVRLMAFEEQHPFHKSTARQIVRDHPNISQGELVRLFGVSVSTIKLWTPSLLAAGWEGPQGTTKSKEPVEPDPTEPSTPSLPKLKWMEGDDPDD